MMTHSSLRLAGRILLAMALAAAAPATAVAQQTVFSLHLPLVRQQSPGPPLSPVALARVSVASDGTEADGDSYGPSLSADGRYVAFASTAANLTAGDSNRVSDVFVHDRQTGATERVSAALDGAVYDRGSRSPRISADGRYVAFVSEATVFGHGTAGGVSSQLGPPMTYWDLVLHDRQTGETTSLAPATEAAISADGRYVAFVSWAADLVSGDTNGAADLFVRDRLTGATTRVSVASDGAQSELSAEQPAISADGRHVAFSSAASNLVGGDTNLANDVFVHDRQTGQTTRVSMSSDGAQGNGDSRQPVISADGRYVAFWSDADNLVSGDSNGSRDVFVHDRQTGQTARVSLSSAGAQGNGGSQWPSISADGRYVAFESYASNLVSDDGNLAADVFLHDRHAGRTIRASQTPEGVEGNYRSGSPAISADGCHVAFESLASTLVGGDGNGVSDVFVSDRGE